jgi:hypothetical protein
MPQRIQRQRTKGWRMPEGAVYVGRPSKWGNPYGVGYVCSPRHNSQDTSKVRSHEEAVSLFRRWVDGESFLPRSGFNQWKDAPTVEEIRRELGGRDVACWCPLDRPCHADVLLEIANRPSPEDARDRYQDTEVDA